MQNNSCWMYTVWICTFKIKVRSFGGGRGGFHATLTRSHRGEGSALSLLFTCAKHECAKPRIFPLIHSPFYLGRRIKSDHYLVKAIMRNKHLFSTAVGKLLSLAPGDLEVTAMRQFKSWAKNLITRETGLSGTELQLAAVVAHPCTHGPGAEWALVTQCTSQKWSVSPSRVHLITLLPEPCAVLAVGS